MVYEIAYGFEMLVRLLLAGRDSYAYLPEVVIKMRVGGVGAHGLKSSWILYREILSACRENGFKTSLTRLLLKIPFKLIEYIRTPK